MRKRPIGVRKTIVRPPSIRIVFFPVEQIASNTSWPFWRA